MTNDAEHQLTATRASLVTSSSVPEARTRRAGDARWETALPHDSVDALISSWRRRRPDLDFSALRVISRLTRVSSHVDAALEQVLGDYGVSRTSFHALVTLERLGGERGVNQRRLMDELGLTSGTISLRMDRLADAGLIERLPDPESRRSTLIALTARGHELFERVTPADLANERRMLSALSDAECEELARLLRKLLSEFEGSEPPPGTPPRLGCTVAPAHRSMAIRESAGLPALPALLVRSVAIDGPAARAGLRNGDLLVCAGGRELRSVAALHDAIDECSRERPLELEVLRDVEEIDLRVAFESEPPPRPPEWSTVWRTANGDHVI